MVGGFIGFKVEINEKYIGFINKGQTLILYTLLLVMGFKIGGDKKVLSSFFNMGFNAIILSIFSITFSVLGVRFVKKYINTNEL